MITLDPNRHQMFYSDNNGLHKRQESKQKQRKFRALNGYRSLLQLGNTATKTPNTQNTANTISFYFYYCNGFAQLIISYFTLSILLNCFITLCLRGE